MDSLAHAISALAIRRFTVLQALERGDSVPGEDDEHLPDLLVSLETALAEFRRLYEERLDDSGLYLSYVELTAIAAD
jgi:hypothetical protein